MAQQLDLTMETAPRATSVVAHRAKALMEVVLAAMETKIILQWPGRSEEGREVSLTVNV